MSQVSLEELLRRDLEAWRLAKEAIAKAKLLLSRR